MKRIVTYVTNDHSSHRLQFSMHCVLITLLECITLRATNGDSVGTVLTVICQLENPITQTLGLRVDSNS